MRTLVRIFLIILHCLFIYINYYDPVSVNGESLSLWASVVLALKPYILYIVLFVDTIFAFYIYKVYKGRNDSEEKVVKEEITNVKSFILAFILIIFSIAYVFVIRPFLKNPTEFVEPYKISDVVTYKDREYSIINYETCTTYNNEESEEGYEYFLLTINIENHSEYDFDPNFSSYVIEADSGKIFEELFPIREYRIIKANDSGQIIVPFKKKIEDKPETFSYYLHFGGEVSFKYRF